MFNGTGLWRSAAMMPERNTAVVGGTGPAEYVTIDPSERINTACGGASANTGAIRSGSHVRAKSAHKVKVAATRNGCRPGRKLNRLFLSEDSTHQ